MHVKWVITKPSKKLYCLDDQNGWIFSSSLSTLYSSDYLSSRSRPLGCGSSGGSALCPLPSPSTWTPVYSTFVFGIAFIYTFMYLWFLLRRCRTLSTMSLCLELASAPSSAASMAVLGRQLRSRRGTRTLRDRAGNESSRSLKFHNHGLLFVESVYQRFDI